VHRRIGTLALGAGFAMVLALGIGLVRLTRSAPLAPPPATTGSAAAGAGPILTAPAAPATRPPEVREAREEPPMSSSSRRAAAASGKQPELAPAMGFGRPELKRDENGHLVPMIQLDELRAQLGRTDAPMKACLERSGSHATGKATIGFTVAARGDHLVIESTGILDEDTLVGYPDMLECMHRTANLFVLDGQPVPELGTAIYVRRHVRVENGALVDNSIFNYSYNP
jgi:hypothetical protein